MLVYGKYIVFRHENVVNLSCVHHVAVLSALFCMTCSLLMMVDGAREEA